MQRKKCIRNERGSIAIIVTVTLMSFYIILLGLYSRASFVRRSQLQADISLKSHYEVEVASLVERARNSGFAWKMVNASNINGGAKVTFTATDDQYNVSTEIFSTNRFNGKFHVGYIDEHGLVDTDPNFPNSIYTDLIYVGGTSTMYKCVGQNENNEVTWLSYRADGSFIGATTGNTYTRSNGAVYVRVMWKNGLTVQESEKIYVCTTYSGDTSTPVYEAPSNKIMIKINNIDYTDKVSITAYQTKDDPKAKEIVVEVRNVPTEGPLKIIISPDTISRVVNGTTEHNQQNAWNTGIQVKP